MRPFRPRVLPLAFSLVVLGAAGWGALVRIGWPWPIPEPSLIGYHGPLMVSGAIGTLIAVERAVALGRRYAYAAPVLAALAAVATALADPKVGAALFTLAGAALTAVLIALSRGRRELFSVTLIAGAAAWTAGSAAWLATGSVTAAVTWWTAFLVLTIVGERLELARVFRPSAAARGLFVAALALTLAGAAASLVAYTPGVRVLGAGMLALAAWLATNDIARRTVARRGVTRFIAVAMLAGYVWLALGGTLAATFDGIAGGARYDAQLHTVFVGFVLSMVFGHAPIVFPAVTGTPLAYRPTFYAHLATLHAAIALRVVGDALASADLVRWAALLSAVAVAIFVANMGAALASVSSGAGPSRASARPR